MNRALFSSVSDDWSTPKDLYESLDKEFHFVDDPCPLGIASNPRFEIGGSLDGLFREWKSPCFVNPPYSDIGPWIEKAFLESNYGKEIVMLVPARTDTKWWHEYAMKSKEIRFIKGRLKFGGRKIVRRFRVQS